MSFTASTRLPLACVTRLAHARHESAAQVQLDPAQLCLMQAFDALYPYQQLDLIRAALESKRPQISGADVLALTRPQHEQHEHPF